MKLQGAVEENVLTLLCWDPEHAPGLLMKLKPELFSTRAYRKIAEVAVDYIQKYNAPPRAHLRDLLEGMLRKGEEGKLLNQTIQAMEGLARDLKPEYVINELDNFIDQRMLTIAIEQASDAISEGDLDKARARLNEAQEKPGATSPGIWLAEPDDMLAFMDQTEDDYISCGIDELDLRGIQLARKTMTLFIAPPKRGKSWWLVEVGKRALLHGKRVLHISLENSEKLTAKRYVQSFFALTSREANSIRTASFVRDDLGHATSIDFDDRVPEALAGVGKARLAARLRKMRKRARFLIKEFPTATLTISALNAYLDYLEKAHGFVPDVLLVDYPDLMAVDSRNLRVDLGVVFKQLRGVAVRRNLALAAVTQGSKAAASSKVVSETMVAEDFSKVATADTILTYSQTREEKPLGLARIMVAAARDAEDKYLVLVSQNYATGQFCLDSVFMTNLLDSELDRLTGVDKPTMDGEDTEG